MFAALLLIATLNAGAQAGEVIAEVRVHGNHISSDDDVIKMAGVTIGAPFTATTIAEITKKLEQSHKFDDVQVLKRFASIADPRQISVVIIVNEGPVKIEMPEVPGSPIRIVKRGIFGRFLYMPILHGEDGYRMTYGMRFALPGIAGKHSRLSFPLTWGGTKRAGAEFERTFSAGPLSRIELGSAIQRERNPAFQINDDRKRVWARVERGFNNFRAGATAGWQRVTFDNVTDDIRSYGADVAVDTRVDPNMPRNAIFAQASWEHLAFASGSDVNRTRMEAHGYIGLFGQPILVLSAARQDASDTLPLYMKSLLGGWSNLRGYKAGAFFGDTMVTASAEVRIPITPTLSVAKFGVSVFVDTGAAYNKGERFKDQELRRGIGGSVWVTVAVFRMSLGVAHGRDAGTRVNFAAGLRF